MPFIQSATSTTTSVTLNGVTAGNNLILISRQESNSRQLLSVSDGTANVWHVAQAGNNPDLAHGVGSAYVINSVGGNITATGTWDSPPTSQTLILAEYSGQLLSLDLSHTTDNATGASSIVLGPFTPAQDVEIHFAYGFGQILNREVESPTTPAFTQDVAVQDIGSTANNLVLASYTQAVNPGAESLTWKSDNGTTNQNFVVGWLSFKAKAGIALDGSGDPYLLVNGH